MATVGVKGLSAYKSALELTRPPRSMCS